MIAMNIYFALNTETANSRQLVIISKWWSQFISTSASDCFSHELLSPPPPPQPLLPTLGHEQGCKINVNQEGQNPRQTRRTKTTPTRLENPPTTRRQNQIQTRRENSRTTRTKSTQNKGDSTHELRGGVCFLCYLYCTVLLFKSWTWIPLFTFNVCTYTPWLFANTEFYTNTLIRVPCICWRWFVSFTLSSVFLHALTHFMH